MRASTTHFWVVGVLANPKEKRMPLLLGDRGDHEAALLIDHIIIPITVHTAHMEDGVDLHRHLARTRMSRHHHLKRKKAHQPLSRAKRASHPAKALSAKAPAIQKAVASVVLAALVVAGTAEASEAALQLGVVGHGDTVASPLVA